jgi:hypothetical protein
MADVQERLIKLRLALLQCRISKGSEDQPRDDHGRFASSDGDVSHPDVMDSDDGNNLAGAVETVPSEMHDSVDAIASAHEDLVSASSDAEDVAAEEDDILEEHGPDSKQHADWKKRNSAAMKNVADKTMALHGAVSDHMENTRAVLGHLTDRINGHAAANGVRGG